MQYYLTCKHSYGFKTHHLPAAFVPSTILHNISGHSKLEITVGVSKPILCLSIFYCEKFFCAAYGLNHCSRQRPFFDRISTRLLFRRHFVN